LPLEARSIFQRLECELKAMWRSESDGASFWTLCDILNSNEGKNLYKINTKLAVN